MANITGLLKIYHRARGLQLIEYEDWLELQINGRLLEILGRRTSLERILEIADSYVTK